MAERMAVRWKRVWGFREHVAAATTALIVLRIALSCVPYRHVKGMVDRRTVKHVLPASEQEVYQRQIIWAIQLTGRYLLGNKPCLPQALALQWFLKRSGIEAEMHIGVKKEAGQFEAHAWIEQDGVVIMGGSESPAEFSSLRTIKT